MQIDASIRRWMAAKGQMVQPRPIKFVQKRQRELSPEEVSALARERAIARAGGKVRVVTITREEWERRQRGETRRDDGESSGGR